MMQQVARCVWDRFLCHVLSKGVQFTTNQRPELPFEFDAVYFDTTCNQSSKILNGQSVQLTTAEITALTKYADSFIDVMDYPVWAHVGQLYIGEMLKSEAIEKNYNYTHIGQPEHAASKLVVTDGKEHWVKVKMVVRDDGTIAIDPPGLCERCICGFTEEEYLKLPKQPTGYHRWDVEMADWYDPRELENTKANAILRVRTDMDPLIWKALGNYAPQYHMATWPIQVEEARTYQLYEALLKSDPKAPQPDCVFLNAFLAARADPGKPTISELAKDILVNSDLQRKVSAEIMALQWSYTKQIEIAETNAAVDSILDDAIKTIAEKMKALAK